MHRSILLLAVLLLAACQSAPSEDLVQTAIAETASAATVTPSHTPTLTTTPSPTPTRTSTPTPSPTPTPEPVMLTESDAFSVLLSVGDLWPGYAILPESTGEMTHDFLLALRGADYADAARDASGWSTGFQRSTNLVDYAFLRSWIMAFPGSEEASVFLNESSSLDDNLVAQQMSFAKFGEESTAAYTPEDTDTTDYDIYEVVFRRRNIVTGLVYISVAGFGNLEEMEEYAALLDQRVSDLIEQQD